MTVKGLLSRSFYPFGRGSGSPCSDLFQPSPSALDRKITEILRVVDEIQIHSKPMIDRSYRQFLINNNDPELREYPDSADQIREIFIHQNYLSSQDIVFCLAYDLAPLGTDADFYGIAALHQSLRNTYAEDADEADSVL